MYTNYASTQRIQTIRWLIHAGLYRDADNLLRETVHPDAFALCVELYACWAPPPVWQWDHFNARRLYQKTPNSGVIWFKFHL